MCSGRRCARWPAGSSPATTWTPRPPLERYSPAQLIGFARRLDPGLTGQDFADAGRRLDELNDRRFTAFGLSPQEIAGLRQRFATWPRQGDAGHG